MKVLSQFFTIQLPSSSATARRDRLIANLVLGTGIRLLEFVSLDVDDVDLGAKHLYIRPKAQVP